MFAVTDAGGDDVRVQLEKEANLEAHNSAIVANASDFIFTATLEGRLLTFNPAGERITGYTQAEARTLRLHDLFSGTDALAEFDRLQREYVDELDPEKLAEGAIRGMFQYGVEDPNSGYMPPEQYQQALGDLSGAFGGIGAEMSIRNTENPEDLAACTEFSSICRLVVIAPLADTPAEEAGLQPGDIVLAVDGEPVDGSTMNDEISRIRGEPGTVSQRREVDVVHHDVGPVLPQLSLEDLPPGHVLRRPQIVDARTRPGDQVGDAVPPLRQSAIVERCQLRFPAAVTGDGPQVLRARAVGHEVDRCAAGSPHRPQVLAADADPAVHGRVQRGRLRTARRHHALGAGHASARLHRGTGRVRR